MARISGQAFTQSYVELHKVRSVEFGFLGADEVARMSVAKISLERIYNEQGFPNYEGINDPRMGTMDKEIKCFTCKGSQTDCPGHPGHIELARPVYHVGCIDSIRKVLRCVCFNCFKLLAPKEKLQEIRKIRNRKSRHNRVLKICDTIKTCDSSMNGCGYKQPKYSKNGLRLMIEYTDEQFDSGRDRKQVLYPDDAFKVLSQISDEDCDIIGFNPAQSRPENMIIKNLLVPPPPVRPSVSMSSTSRSEDDLTYAYTKILQCNNQLLQNINKGANQTNINSLRENLQYFVATVMDNEISGQPTQKHKSGKALKAIRARLKGKEGRLRGNLMGKRVDFSARTVITPDPILQLDQLGVPQQIAMNLTIPETVTSENIDEMRTLVANGPSKWPGAKFIIRHDDRQIDLSQMKNRSDAHLEAGYKVERHLRNDDYVIFNRQPSLHKMSLMGHRVKVLPFSTFRLNLSVTTPYNADFDGDEMNMHVPQSYETMAEVKEIMAVPNQIVSPQSNKPVMGIVQDSLLGVMLFTLKDCYLEKDVVMSLLMWINFVDDKFPQPCILKPKPLWSGKQIFSLIIPNVNFVRYNEKNPNNWASEQDKNTLISKGELMCGNITKGVIGNTSGGLIHLIWKEKGPYPCRDFLSNTQLVINNWLHQNGFTVGVEDIIPRKDITEKIKEKMKSCKVKVQKILQDAQMGKLKQQPGKSMIESFEASVNRELNTARDDSGNIALNDLYSWNRLKSMVYAGSKGSNLNISQIMACVGQQNVEGKRIPFGFHKRTLPHFSKDDFGPESKGFVENCYLSGLTPSEFYFHAMGGREGLIDTAVKTAETGYIARRLIKALEDVMVKYDGTVRTSKEQVIQFLYGEDGMAGEHIEDVKINLLMMDTKKMKDTMCFLDPQLSMPEQVQILSRSMPADIVQQVLHQPATTLRLQQEYNQIIKDRDDLRYHIIKTPDDNIHLPVNVPRILLNAKEQFSIKPNSQTSLHPIYILDKLEALMKELSVIPGVQGVLKDDRLLKDASENSTWLFRIYLRQLLNTKALIQQERLSQDAFDWVIGEIKSRFEQSIINPGESVGSIAAQSLGEPATQMTLNTFHQAGVSAKNVTLGVPRLKEIINVAKNIKTPSMKIYLKDKYKKDQKKVTLFGGKIEHTTLAHVVKSSAIYYDPDPRNTVVKEDQALISLYNDVPLIDSSQHRISPWLLRFELDNEKMQFKDLTMELIERKISEQFVDQVNIIHSDDNDDKLVVRLRVTDIEDDEEETVCMYLKEFQDQLFNELALKGIRAITKVSFTKYKENEFEKVVQEKGAAKEEETWLIETDGVALQKVFACGKIDFKRTVSNDIIEILNTLGIEAVRLSLINELRFVLNSYGIYVNYRHLSTLCDVMTQRGILTSITRHGINRVDTGPLRRCSFEETVEILLEAATFSEIDPLKGISENLIMGQLAPFGTGCFDLVIDDACLQENAKTKPDAEDVNGGHTDYHNSFEDHAMHLYAIATPLNDGTPQNYGAMQSEYGQNTPGYSGSFSPGYNNAQMNSPSYMQSPNPYRSPTYGETAYRNIQSPMHGGYQTPIYSVGDHNVGGSIPYQQQSPGASPLGRSAQSPYYGQSSTPAYYSGNAASSPYYSSGGVQANAGASQLNYSPTDQMSGSANYSPTNYNASNSPRYSPTTPNYQQSYSPSYSPTSNAYGSSASPRYIASASPRYTIESGHSSNPSSVSGSPSVGLYNASNPYFPSSSPAYNPASPAYEPSSAYQPPTSLGMGSPIDDSITMQKKPEIKKE